MASEEISLTVKSSGDKKYNVSISPDASILDLKEKIATESDIPAANQRLIYSGRVLKDADTVANYKIQSGHTIHLVRGGGANKPTPAAAAASSSAATASGSSSQANTTGAPTNIASGQGTGAQNPFLALTNLQNMGYNVPMPSESMFGSDGGLTSMPDENTIADMLEQPGVQSMMNQMLSDPAMIDMMIQQSPQLRSMGPQAREMLQSDYMRQMLTNPQMMRQALAMNRAFGGMSGGAGGASSSFPAPGPASNSSTPAPESSSNTENTASTPPVNPFAALLQNNGGAGGASNPFGGLFGAFPPPPSGSSDQQANPFMNPDLLNLFLGGQQQQQLLLSQDTRPPEERYESQLRQLNDMGFGDFDRNVSALRRSGGSVQGAIEALLNGDV